MNRITRNSPVDARMTESTSDLLEAILRQCQAAEPEPWYPKLYAETSGVPRDSLDAPLEKLRMANLIRLTEWVQGRGQGYQLTKEGRHTLSNGRELAKVRNGEVPRRQEPSQPRSREVRGGTAWERGEAIRDVFLNPPNPIVTKSLLFTNVLVFAAGCYLAMSHKIDVNLFLQGGDDKGRLPIQIGRLLHATGALSPEDIALGGWGWMRLLTSAFVHIGLIHLLVNSVSLYILGRVAEPMFGHGRYLLLYLIAAISGGCGALMTNIGIGAGASGAICGLLGAITVWFLLNRSYMPPELASRGLRSIMLNAILLVVISMVPGISWSGHLGGAIAGAAAAVLLHYQRYGAGLVRWLALAALPLIPVASAAAMMHTLRTSPLWAQAQMELREQRILEAGKELRDRYRREALEADGEMRRAYGQALRTSLWLHPERRDADKTKQAITDLANAQTELNAAIDRMAADPPLKEEDVEAQRQRTLEYMRALAQLGALAESHLREDRNLTGEVKDALEKQEMHVAELKPSWIRFGS
jgi:membrane associated rhomboid family serine protease